MIKSINYIETGFFKLDGGAMFGVVPKSMWSKLNPPDENNMCTWAMRCLLLQTTDRKILIDTGMGDKQDAKFRSHFHPHGEHNLHDSLYHIGVKPSEITDVLLTHLHFDHCGGAVTKTDSGELCPTFANAKYWIDERHYHWALNPNEREQASFLKENFVPLMDHGVLHFIDVKNELWPTEITVDYCYGHTEAMAIYSFEYQNNTYKYCADLLPSSFHLSIPFIMAYDLRPLESLQEKKTLLFEAIEHQHVLILEHDPKTRACTIKRSETGKIVVDQSF